MLDGESRAKAIKHLLATEDYIISEIQSANNSRTREELYKQLKECQKQRHELIRELYPTACTEPLHRAVALLKEESSLESILLKNLDTSNPDQMRTAERVSSKLQAIRMMRERAIEEANKCAVPPDSKDNRCYVCEQKGAADKTKEVADLVEKIDKNAAELKRSENQRNIKRNDKTDERNNEVWQTFLEKLLSR